MFKTFSSFFIASVFLLLLISCSDEKKTAKQLDGFWKISSYLVYKDSTNQEFELIGLSAKDGQLIFKEYDTDLSIGNLEIVLTDVISEEELITNGTYSLDDSGEQLTFDLRDGRENILTLDVNKESLTLEGVLDSARVKIESFR